MIYATIVNVIGFMGLLTFVADTGGGHRVELWDEACCYVGWDGVWRKNTQKYALPDGTVVKYLPGRNGKPFAWTVVSTPEDFPIF